MQCSQNCGFLALLPLFFNICSTSLFAQQDPVFPDRDNSPVTKQLFNVLMAGREVEYFGLPVYFNSSQFGRTMDSLPTRRSFPFFEANLAPYYVILKGRDLQRDWLKRFSIAFEPQMTFRIYLSSEQSFPVRPPNFQPKFHFNYFIHRALDSTTTRFHQLSFVIAHLSNGQPRTFFLDSAKTTVNLINGNFSTNYLRFGYTFNKYLHSKEEVHDRDGWKSNALWSASLAYQREISIGNLLTFDEDMDLLGYGRNRLLARLQFRSGNFMGTRAVFSSYTQPPVYQVAPVPIVERDTVVQRDGKPVTMHYIKSCYIVRKVDAIKRRSPKGYWNWMARWDNAVVLDKKATNRVNSDFIFEMRNLNWRSFSIIAKCSWGRDYMNLRFGENIQSYQIGISYNMDRYKVPYTKYIEVLNENDVINLNDRRNPEMTDRKDKLNAQPSITAGGTGKKSYTLYNNELDVLGALPSTIVMDSESFERPPCFRLQNGEWSVVTEERKKLKHIHKPGWYHADNFEYDKELNRH